MNPRSSTRRASAVALLLGALLLLALAARWVVPQLGLVERFNRAVAPEPRPNHIVARLENGTRLVMPYQSPAPAPVAKGTCEFEPLLAPANRRDGRYQLADGPGDALPDAAAYLRVARDAAAAERHRDSEVALIMACRIATGAGAPDAAQAVEVQERLAALYLEQARSAGAEAPATVYRERAQWLLERKPPGETPRGALEPA